MVAGPKITVGYNRLPQIKHPKRVESCVRVRGESWPIGRWCRSSRNGMPMYLNISHMPMISGISCKNMSLLNPLPLKMIGHQYQLIICGTRFGKTMWSHLYCCSKFCFLGPANDVATLGPDPSWGVEYTSFIKCVCMCVHACVSVCTYMHICKCCISVYVFVMISP